LGVEDASKPEEEDDLAPFQIRRRWEKRCIKQERLLQTYTVHITLLFMKKLEKMLSYFRFKTRSNVCCSKFETLLKKLSKFASNTIND
jgi:hypothetical protein